MCNILILNPGQQLKAEIHNANALHNADGIGMMALEDNKLITMRSTDMSLKRIMALDKQYRHLTRAYHYRMGTSGRVAKEYTHPFQTRHGYLMHNGVISGLSCAQHSDTYNLANIIDKLPLQEALFLLQSYAGQRFALLLRTKADARVANHSALHDDSFDNNRLLLFGTYRTEDKILQSSPVSHKSYLRADYRNWDSDWIRTPSRPTYAHTGTYSTAMTATVTKAKPIGKYDDEETEWLEYKRSKGLA